MEPGAGSGSETGQSSHGQCSGWRGHLQIKLMQAGMGRSGKIGEIGEIAVFGGRDSVREGAKTGECVEL